MVRRLGSTSAGPIRRLLGALAAEPVSRISGHDLRHLLDVAIDLRNGLPVVDVERVALGVLRRSALAELRILPANTADA